MKTGKLITYNIIGLLAILNLIMVYIVDGISPWSLTKEYALKLFTIYAQFSILFLIILFVNLSYVVSKAITKKNLLRIALVFTTIELIWSFVMRAIEFNEGTIFVFGIFQTVLFIVLIILNISILKDLFRLIQKLFLRNKNNI